MNSLEHAEAGHPIWIVGFVDSHGAVHAREISEHQSVYGSSSHSPYERSAGRPFRWGIWQQDFGEVRQGCEFLDADDRIRVLDWLEDHGWVDERRMEKETADVVDTSAS